MISLWSRVIQIPCQTSGFWGIFNLIRKDTIHIVKQKSLSAPTHANYVFSKAWFTHYVHSASSGFNARLFAQTKPLKAFTCKTLETVKTVLKRFIAASLSILHDSEANGLIRTPVVDEYQDVLSQVT